MGHLSVVHCLPVMLVSPEPAAKRSRHIAVMPREVIDALCLAPGLTVMDGTVGAGGHARLILDRILPDGRLFGFDRDPMMLRFAKLRLNHPQVELIHGSYSEARERLDDHQVSEVDRVLLDLGLSSDQLADRERGFGFDSGGPLDMRFDSETGCSVAAFLQDSSADEIADVIREYGEDRHAVKIANEIVARQRSSSPLETVDDLLSCISRASGRRNAGQPDRGTASRVFQAFRIAVNDELGHVRRMMTETLPQVVCRNGIAVVITFHSLEDRIVKHAFRDDPRWKPLTKSPIEASPAEVRLNPRARSARLRSAQRIESPGTDSKE